MSTAPPEPSKSLIDKLGAALPIGLTALATVFAGMSTGELQSAMYWKSQAAQDQAKSTNQWTLAGFKVDRSLIMQTTAATLVAGAGYAKGSHDFDANNPLQVQAKDWLQGKGPPPVYRRTDDAKRKEAPAVGLPDVPEKLGKLLDAIKDRKGEDEVLKLATEVSIGDINKAIDDAEAGGEKITEKDWDPVVKEARNIVAKSVNKAVKGDSPVDPAAAGRAAATQASLFEMDQRRYRGEATINQEIGYLYEARVKFASAESDKHKKKSQQLFLAMLAAQIGAVIASLALARKTGSALWLFAGVAGLLAIGFGAVVFLDQLPGK